MSVAIDHRSRRHGIQGFPPPAHGRGRAGVPGAALLGGGLPAPLEDNPKSSSAKVPRVTLYQPTKCRVYHQRTKLLIRETTALLDAIIICVL